MTITSYDAPLTEAEFADLAQLEEVIEQGLQTFYMTGAALATVRDTRLYRTTHGTFEDYCEDRWNLKRRMAYRLIEAAGVVENVSNWTQTLPANEAQARSLAQLPAEQQGPAWQEAVETASEGKPTAAHVATVVERFRRPEPADAPTPIRSDTEARPTAINPDAIIAPPTPFVAAVAERLVSDGGFRRNAILEEFHATCQRQMGVWQKSRDLLKHIDPAEIAALLDDDEAKSIAHVIGYTNDLLVWFQRAAEARETPAGIRRVK